MVCCSLDQWQHKRKTPPPLCTKAVSANDIFDSTPTILRICLCHHMTPSMGFDDDALSASHGHTSCILWSLLSSQCTVGAFAVPHRRGSTSLHWAKKRGETSTGRQINMSSSGSSSKAWFISSLVHAVAMVAGNPVCSWPLSLGCPLSYRIWSAMILNELKHVLLCGDRPKDLPGHQAANPGGSAPADQETHCGVCDSIPGSAHK